MKISCFFMLLFYISINYSIYAAPLKSDSVSITEKNWKDIKKGVDYTETYKEITPRKNSSFHFPSLFLNSVWLQFITALIIICILVFIIFKILVKYNFSLSQKIVKNTDFKLLEDNPDIDDLDLDAMLADVLKAGNYRLAIRIRFLQVIKLLNISSHIKWEKDKTNGDYITEMRNYPEITDFMYLVVIFNSIWYGDKLLNGSDYKILNSYFENFIQKLKQNEQ